MLAFHRLEAIARAAKARSDEEDGGDDAADVERRAKAEAEAEARGASGRARERRAAARDDRGERMAQSVRRRRAQLHRRRRDRDRVRPARRVSRGYAAAWTTLAHELPQELGDYGILRRSGFTDAEALGFNFLSALVAVAATALTFLVLAALDAASASACARSAVVARLALDVPYLRRGLLRRRVSHRRLHRPSRGRLGISEASSLALLRAFAAAVLVARRAAATRPRRASRNPRPRLRAPPPDVRPAFSKYRTKLRTIFRTDLPNTHRTRTKHTYVHDGSATRPDSSRGSRASGRRPVTPRAVPARGASRDAIARALDARRIGANREAREAARIGANRAATRGASDDGDARSGATRRERGDADEVRKVRIPRRDLATRRARIAEARGDARR